MKFVQYILIFLDLSPPNLKTKKVFAEVDIELVFDKLDSLNFQKKKNC